MPFYLIVYGYDNSCTPPSNNQFNFLIEKNVGNCISITPNVVIVASDKNAKEIYTELSNSELFANHPEIFQKTLLVTQLTYNTEFPLERADIMEWINARDQAKQQL